MPSPGASAAPILAYDSLDSTNAEARRRAEAGEGGPLWITALEQTAGRGRRGRAWSTRMGNLAATFLTTTSRPPADAARTAFAAALAVADLADAYAPPGLVQVKWPNDVLLDGRKLSGALIESGAMGEGRLWLAVGIGVNLAHAPADVERPATALADHLRGDAPRAPTPSEALAVLAASLAAWLARWDAEGFEPLAAAWSARAANLGRRCLAQLPDGPLEGLAEALEPDGALRLRLDDGAVRRITAGDVFLPGEAPAPQARAG
jgi:BirA family biotin operon repressor/biotin-[acetyl-CoA-carboxylase] ligase